MNRRLIVTADDYGMCDTVNQAIEECLAAGTVRATCAMANMSTFSSTASLRERFPQSSLGIHWTLTEGRPVLLPLQIPSLIRPDGSFYNSLQFRQRWLRRQVAVPELKAELRAQYERFRETVGEPDFWNTHQNFHVWPGLFEACVTLGRELGIPSMRCHRRFTVPYSHTPILYHLRHPLPWLKGQVITWWASRARRQGMLMPDGVVHMPGYEPVQTSIDEVMVSLPWASIKSAVELIVHPATTNDEPLFHRYAERRVLEYHVFTDSRLSKRLCQLGVEPVGFEVLHNGGERVGLDGRL